MTNLLPATVLCIPRCRNNGKICEMVPATCIATCLFSHYVYLCLHSLFLLPTTIHMNVPYYLTIEKGLVHFGLEVRKISYICPVLFTPLIGSPYSTVSSLPPSSSDSSTLSSDFEYQRANSTPATSPPLALPPALPQPSQTTAMT